jgi:hypothetical protein
VEDHVVGSKWVWKKLSAFGFREFDDSASVVSFLEVRLHEPLCSFSQEYSLTV